MKESILWSLRLGFTIRQSNAIEKLGIEQFLANSFNHKYSKEIPSCLKDSPKIFK